MHTHDYIDISSLERIVARLAIFEESPALMMHAFATPMGAMVAIADDQGLYAIAFFDEKRIEQSAVRMQKYHKRTIIVGINSFIEQVVAQMISYFKGERTTFKIPLVFSGTVFSKKVWHLLQNIPCGTTASYGELACMIGNAKAVRAVARANSINQHLIIVPCHRVINADGSLGGFSAGLAYKKLLLSREKLMIR